LWENTPGIPGELETDFVINQNSAGTDEFWNQNTQSGPSLGLPYDGL